ncbi:MAG: STAS domain-containing protein [Gammaproteobacteria bacterium]|nr:STAS domain-containing protein [Gammaproteobacteria bacterium]
MVAKKKTKKAVSKKAVSKKVVSKKKSTKKLAKKSVSSPTLLLNDPLALMSVGSGQQETAIEDVVAAETKTQTVSAVVKDPVETAEEVSANEMPAEEVQVEEMSEEPVTDALSTNDSDIVFTGPLTIATTEEWLSKIVEIIQTAHEIKIDASEVSQVDGSGLQLICSLVKSAESKSIKVQWIGNNETVKDAAIQAGLDKAIGL